MSERLAYSIAEAAQLSGLSRTTLYEAIGDGRLRRKKAGRKALILAADLEKFLTNLPEGE